MYVRELRLLCFWSDGYFCHFYHYETDLRFSHSIWIKTCFFFVCLQNQHLKHYATMQQYNNTTNISYTKQSTNIHTCRYPKPNRHPNDECVILNNRKGFIKLALKNNIPLIPVFCFGASKTFKRLQLPRVIEQISNFLRLSIVFIFGRYGTESKEYIHSLHTCLDCSVMFWHFFIRLFSCGSWIYYNYNRSSNTLSTKASLGNWGTNKTTISWKYHLPGWK